MLGAELSRVGVKLAQAITAADKKYYKGEIYGTARRRQKRWIAGLGAPLVCHLII